MDASTKYTSPDASARAQIDSDLKTAAECMKDAARMMSKAFTEMTHLRTENSRLMNRVRDLEAENRKLQKWRDIGERINKAIKEADDHAESVRADGQVQDAGGSSVQR